MRARRIDLNKREDETVALGPCFRSFARQVAVATWFARRFVSDWARVALPIANRTEINRQSIPAVRSRSRWRRRMRRDAMRNSIPVVAFVDNVHTFCFYPLVELAGKRNFLLSFRVRGAVPEGSYRDVYIRLVTDRVRCFLMYCAPTPIERAVRRSWSGTKFQKQVNSAERSRDFNL